MEISDQELDRLIISLALPNWQKVAMVIAKSFDRLDMQIDADRLAARIEHLVRTGRLESQGNLSRWRYSEIRLAAEEPA